MKKASGAGFDVWAWNWTPLLILQCLECGASRSMFFLRKAVEDLRAYLGCFGTSGQACGRFGWTTPVTQMGMPARLAPDKDLSHKVLEVLREPRRFSEKASVPLWGSPTPLR